MAFKKRTTAPSKDNKWFYKNNPFYACGYGLPNCTAYAWGRFAEILGKAPALSTSNAENWYSHKDGYARGKTPKLGAVIVWAKGKVGVGSDGAGHVAIVIEVIDSNTIRTAESGYGNSTPFWIATRKNNNGRWGTNSNYPLRGFIENPNYPHNKPVPPTPQPTPTPIPTPTPQPITYKVGDEVIVNGVLTADSYGGGAHTKNYKNKKAKIIIIKNDGRPRPYALNMNNNMNGVTGWGSKDQIRK